MVFEKICCIGAGHVGAPACSVIALKCPNIKVTVCDKNEKWISKWNSEKLPINEQELYKIVQTCRGKNLFFSTNIAKGIQEAEVIFISVNTPTKAFGNGKGRAADLKYVEGAARMIAELATSNKIVVEKSTVPVKTAEVIKKILHANMKPRIEFQILSNPDCYSEGSAVVDLLEPERVLIGGEDTTDGHKAIQELFWLYEHWIPAKNILTTNTWSSELSKLAANAFLAQRISSINSLSDICEATGGDMSVVARAIGRDSRIGPKFLKASIEFEGSSFQRDILSLIYLCECLNLPEVAAYWQQVVDFNDFRKTRFTRNVIESLFATVSDKKIAILGCSFKKYTVDTKESPAIHVIKTLLDEGAKLHIYDPKDEIDQIFWGIEHACMTLEPEIMRNNVQIHDSPYSAVSGTHAIVLCTECDEFKELDFKKIYDVMMKPAYIFDRWKILDHEALLNLGFHVSNYWTEAIKKWKYMGPTKPDYA